METGNPGPSIEGASNSTLATTIPINARQKALIEILTEVARSSGAIGDAKAAELRQLDPVSAMTKLNAMSFYIENRELKAAIKLREREAIQVLSSDKETKDIGHNNANGEEAKRLTSQTEERLESGSFGREASAHKYQESEAVPACASGSECVRHFKEAKLRRPHLRTIGPTEQIAARKSYIAAWKAAHPERQREYNRRWQLKRRIKVGDKKWLTHGQSLQKMQELPPPFSAKQYAVHVGITHQGACNLFNTLIVAGKIKVVKKEGCAQLCEVCSSTSSGPQPGVEHP